MVAFDVEESGGGVLGERGLNRSGCDLLLALRYDVPLALNAINSILFGVRSRHALVNALSARGPTVLGRQLSSHGTALESRPLSHYSSDGHQENPGDTALSQMIARRDPPNLKHDRSD
jgi:hypothetical protein